jgi:hypothetical protein
MTKDKQHAKIDNKIYFNEHLNDCSLHLRIQHH